MRRMFQADQPKPDFAGRIMSKYGITGKYGIARWRSRLQALILRLNPKQSVELAARENNGNPAATAGPAVHVHYHSHTTRLMTQRSAPVYATNRIVRINRMSPVTITHRSSMVFLPQVRRADGNRHVSDAAGSSAAMADKLVQAEHYRPSAHERRIPVTGDSAGQLSKRASAQSRPAFPARAQAAQDDVRPVSLDETASFRERQLLQPMQLIQYQMRILQTFRAREQVRDNSLERLQSAAFRTYAPLMQPKGSLTGSRAPTGTALDHAGYAAPSREQADHSGAERTSASAANKSAERYGISSGHSGYPSSLAPKQVVPLTLTLSKGLARILDGAGRAYSRNLLKTGQLRLSYSGGKVQAKDPGEQTAGDAVQATELLTARLHSANVVLSNSAKRRDRRDAGYGSLQQAPAPLQQDADTEADTAALPALPILHAARRRLRQRQTAAPAMLLRHNRSLSDATAHQELLPAAAVDSGLVHRRPETGRAQRDSRPASGETYTQDKTVTYSAAPAFQQASKQKTTMGADEIHLVAEQVFQVLEKRLSIQKDRRGLR